MNQGTALPRSKPEWSFQKLGDSRSNRAGAGLLIRGDMKDLIGNGMADKGSDLRPSLFSSFLRNQPFHESKFSKAKQPVSGL